MARRRPLSALGARLANTADRRDSRVPTPLRTRIAAIRQERTSILQLSIGAGLAWYVAHNLIGHVQPFFAPIAAILTVLVSIGQRRRLVVELAVGVSVGVLVGELLITLIGRGAWQIFVIVGLAVVSATFLGLRGFARNQSATSAALIAAVVPVGSAVSPAVTRFTDALVGGFVGLIMTVVIPGNPVRRVDREVQSVLRGLAEQLDKVVDSLTHRDAGPAWTALQELRAMQPTIEGLATTVSGADEVARISPMRWRQRGHVELYAAVIRDIDNAVRDARVLSRRVHTMLRQREAPPAGVERSVSALAAAVRVFSNELTVRDEFDEAQDKLVGAARAARIALPSAATLNASATVAQIRAIASDLLYATGATPPEVDDRLNSQ